MDPFNWTCPYCGHAQSVVGRKRQNGEIRFDDDKDTEFGHFVLSARAVICSNKECRRVELSSSLYEMAIRAGKREYKHIRNWPLLPDSLAKPQPNCVPEVIQKDYYEACSIQSLSPKAAATLARRCLQGMIRDFCGISKRTLFEEIKELRRQVEAHEADPNITPDSVNAIDDVRKIGKYGAHMEEDINLIIEVDENEVEVLIHLIEALFKEWYIARDTRKKTFAQITAIADDKEAQKNNKKDGGAKEAPEG